MKNVVRTAHLFKEQAPKEIKDEIEEVEEEARVARLCTPDDDVRREFEALLLRPKIPSGSGSFILEIVGYRLATKLSNEKCPGGTRRSSPSDSPPIG